MTVIRQTRNAGIGQVRAAQMKDVAERAGVSITTVSHVLNNTRPVAPETRERVRRVISELNYYQNAFGRRLARGRSDAFGLLISDIENPFFPELVKGFEGAVVDAGFDVLLCTTGYDPKRSENAVRRMIENKVQGVAVMTSQLEVALVERLIENGIPVVLLDAESTGRGRSSIRVDYSRGAAESVGYLRDLGHERIAFITGRQTRTSARTYRHAVVTAVEKAGLSLLRCIPGDNTVDGGRAGMRVLLNERIQPTAVLCGNDLAALGAVRALVEAGLRVPDDVSVVGADDIYVSAFTSPPLTTIRIARDQVGQRAFEALKKLIQTKRQTGGEYVIETHLVVRESTAAPRPGAIPLATA